MPLLNIPKSVKQTRTKVVQQDTKVSKRTPKIAQTDEELSLKIFELFSGYDCTLATTEEQLLAFIGREKEFGIDTETSGLQFYKDKIAGFSLGTRDRSVYVPLAHEVGVNYTGDMGRLYDILSSLELYGFNWKFDKHFLVQFDKRFENLIQKGDGYLMARLYNNTMDAGLKPLYKRFIDQNVEDYSFGSLFSRAFNTYDAELVYPYAAVDAQKHLIIGKYLESKLQEMPGLYRLYKNLELPLTEVVGRMEEHGIQLDRGRIYELNGELTVNAENILKEIQSIAGENFNPGSPKQVGEALRGLGLLQAGEGTGEAVLEAIKDKHPLPHLILEYRGQTKLSGTYTVGLLNAAGQDAVAHPSFNQLGTDTGRFSSTNFNAQNIPKDNRFRNLFIPKEGNMLISVDYSQQEVRVLAALAEDEVMIEAFRSGKDFYAFMASIAYNLPYESCTKTGEFAKHRNEMKSIVLGLNYDMGMKSLAANLGKTVEEAEEVYHKFRKMCPSIDVFKKKNKEFGYSHGYVETVLKRRRYFDGVGYKALGLPRFECDRADILQVLQQLENDRWGARRLIEDAKKEGIYVKDRESIAFKEERQCTNSVIQGSSADMTKLAMLSFDRDKEAQRLGARIVLQIHDEIIIEAPRQNAVEAGDRLAFIMNGVGAELMNGLPAGGVPCVMERWEKD